MRGNFWISLPTSKAVVCCNDQIATKQTSKKLTGGVGDSRFSLCYIRISLSGEDVVVYMESNVGFYTFGGIFLDFVELDERVCEECCLNFSEDF
jgi:hypothetical protein